jgi:hypothetical protein
MDELTRTWFEMTCRQRLLQAQGQAFQDLVNDLMEHAYPRDFQRVCAYGNEGDHKCDGYLASRRTVLQVYAPCTLCQLRKIAVHRPADLKPGELSGALTETEELLSMMSSEPDKSADD